MCPDGEIYRGIRAIPQSKDNEIVCIMFNEINIACLHHTTCISYQALQPPCHHDTLVLL